MTKLEHDDDTEKESLLASTYSSKNFINENAQTQQSTPKLCNQVDDSIEKFHSSKVTCRKQRYRSLEDLAVKSYLLSDERKTYSKSTSTLLLEECIKDGKKKNFSVDGLKSIKLAESCEKRQKEFQQRPHITIKTKSYSSKLDSECSLELHQESNIYGAILPNNEGRYLLISRETSQSSDSTICRICHSYGDDPLIAPCKCAGSSRYVHASCLVTWFKKCVKNQCELCKAEVKIRKVNHKLSLWRKPEDRPFPLVWFSLFFVGLFLNILSIYVNASEHCKSTACLIFYVVNGFGIVLDAAFLWFWFLKCRLYLEKWCALNQDWFIDITEDDELKEPSLQVGYMKDRSETPPVCLV